jgi:hypothetical protein
MKILVFLKFQAANDTELKHAFVLAKVSIWTQELGASNYYQTEGIPHCTNHKTLNSWYIVLPGLFQNKYL